MSDNARSPSLTILLVSSLLVSCLSIFLRMSSDPFLTMLLSVITSLSLSLSILLYILPDLVTCSLLSSFVLACSPLSHPWSTVLLLCLTPAPALLLYPPVSPPVLSVVSLSLSCLTVPSIFLFSPSTCPNSPSFSSFTMLLLPGLPYFLFDMPPIVYSELLFLLLEPVLLY